MTMNCHNMQAHWDDARDEALGDIQQIAFDQHLRQCASCASLWRRETQLLDALVDDVEPAHADEFVLSVLNHADRPAVEPLIRRLVPWAALAAAVVLTLTVWVVLRTPNTTRHTVALSHTGEPTHPFSVLVQNLSNQIDKPRRLTETIDKTTALLSFNGLAQLVECQMPADKAATPHTRD